MRVPAARRIAATLACAALTLGGCASQPAKPPPAPAVASPADAIPPDLDVTVRIDVAGLRDALGSTAFALLSARAKQSAAGMDPGAERLLVDLLARADTLWVAFRPGLGFDRADNVVVLRGRFERLDPRDYEARPAWQSADDLGGGWRQYDRARPHSRAAPARVLMRGDDLVVLVSYAELDSVDRDLEGSQASRSMVPTETGTFSIAARVRPLAEAMASRSTAAARLLAEATTLQATVSLSATGLEARLSVDFEQEDQAHRAAEATTLLFRGLAEQNKTFDGILPSLHVEAVGSALVLSAKLERERLSDLATCAAAGTCG